MIYHAEAPASCHLERRPWKPRPIWDWIAG